MMIKIKFKFQLFKGNVSSTTTYTPSPEENALLAQQLKYQEAFYPNVIRLNRDAGNILWDSYGDIQADFNTANQQAQRQIANSTNQLSNIANNNAMAAAATNAAIGGLANQYTGASNSSNSTLGNLSNQYGNAANTTNATLAGLAQGNLPSAYQNAMERSIESSLQRTMGSGLNNLANRGVLNSSVTTQAMNDISRNAADMVAQQYQNNIGQVANLSNQQLGNTNTALGQQYDIANQQLSNTGNALDRVGNIYQSQLGNTTNANESNTNIYQNQIANAAVPMTTMAAAQEAAQQPALNLWNASLGIQQSGNSVLGNIAGKYGTSTTSKSGGGSPWLSGLTSLGSAFLGGFGSGLGSRS